VTYADNHVHSEWSWDATKGDMEATCRHAAALGLSAIAFTEHADWIRGDEAVFDPAAYLEAIEHCRTMFPGLRILSGVEMGEPHQYPREARRLLAAGFDRTLASVHCVEWKGQRTDASEPGFLAPADVDAIFRLYLREVLALVQSDQPFQVLAHLDYPKRYWPGDPAYDEAPYEDEYRAVLRAAAARDAVLELNTSRGGAPERYLCPGPVVLSWWREEGGRALSFGSDAHSPQPLAAGFELAQELAEAAGFRPQDDPTAFWVR
jgi:histidinol-phosphatase (PHP family)